VPLGQVGGEVGDQRRLAAAALLVDECDAARNGSSPSALMRWAIPWGACSEPDHSIDRPTDRLAIASFGVSGLAVSLPPLSALCLCSLPLPLPLPRILLELSAGTYCWNSLLEFSAGTIGWNYPSQLSTGPARPECLACDGISFVRFDRLVPHRLRVNGKCRTPLDIAM